MKKTILLSAMMLISVTAFSQKTTKLDMSLYKLAKSEKSAQARSMANSEKNTEYVYVCAALKDGYSLPEKELTDLGILVDNNAYGVVDMRVPVGCLDKLDKLEAFSMFEGLKASQPDNFISHQVERVDTLQDAVKAQAAGLPQTYTGEGVVVGVYDSGIDFNHANFRDPVTKKTRIKSAVAFRNFSGVSGSSEETMSFIDLKGNKAPATAIMETYTNESDIDTLTTDTHAQSHGTHTSSTAAGSYSGGYDDVNGKTVYTGYQGAAYKADLVLAGAKSLYGPFERLALKNMDDYATSVNKPLVINLSIGSSIGWMDGKSTMNTFIDNFTDYGNKPGRIICQSAGNNAIYPFAIYKTLDESNNYSLKTFMGHSADSINTMVYLFSNDTTQLDVSLTVYDALTKQVVEEYPVSELIARNLYAYSWSETHDFRYNSDLKVDFKNITEAKRVAINVRSKYGTPCKVRMFAYTSNSLDPYSFRSYDEEGYTAGETSSSINPACCTFSELCVGSWSENNDWTPYLKSDTIVHTNGFVNSDFPIGDIAIYSSYIDEDDNGFSHPDFAAPGTGVMSGYNNYDYTYFDNDGNVRTDRPFTTTKVVAGVAHEEYGRTDGRRSYLGEMQGTSMSCPNAVGVIALWLQANPELTLNQVREVIKNTADKDSFTSGVHGNRFGAGKINALAGLKYILKNYPTAIHNIDAYDKLEAETNDNRKVIENGRLVIKKNGKKYNAVGQQL